MSSLIDARCLIQRDFCDAASLRMKRLGQTSLVRRRLWLMPPNRPGRISTVIASEAIYSGLMAGLRGFARSGAN